MISDDSFEASLDTQRTDEDQLDRAGDSASQHPSDSQHTAASADGSAHAPTGDYEDVEGDDEDVQAAKEAWEGDAVAPAIEPFTSTVANSDTDDAASAWGSSPPADPVQSDQPAESGQFAELAQPFVGRWNTLISTTNWEKGGIISQWRAALIESGADATEYSDDAWARRVGGVTAPHVGRLRRVHDRFGSTYQTYEGLYWSHFLAALDWDDAPLWLEGASREGWSVSGMREHRWQAHGAVESQRPTNSQIIEVDLDEDVTLPAQGDDKRREYDDDNNGVSTGPVYEAPDFGDEEELTALDGSQREGDSGIHVEEQEAPATPVQAFAGLPELPSDLADAIEQMKLAILRHKTAGWENVTPEIVQRYLDAMGMMIRA